MFKYTNSEILLLIYYHLPALWPKSTIKLMFLFFQLAHQNFSAALESFIIVCGTNRISDVAIYGSVRNTARYTFTALFHLSGIFLLFSLFISCWAENCPFLRQ
jgi:hypothetical protein